MDLTDDERVAKANYVRNYKNLLDRYEGKDDAEERARAVAQELVSKKFGAETALKVRNSYHGT